MSATSPWCPHVRPCPAIGASDSDTAEPVLTDPSTGAELLCNGLLVEAGHGPDRTVVPLRRADGPATWWFTELAHAFRSAMRHLDDCRDCPAEEFCPDGDVLADRLERLLAQGEGSEQRERDRTAA
ncbi:DUF5999 family protein [Actinacidiphila alni]|uniref:DUF5999 family protein n=1 Tax=Actinacidiphila alni TaxID=380248 RepID=UPI003454E7A2